jgi:hypothetical protein
MNRYLITIEGSGWQDVEEIELPRIPAEDDVIETKYGTCLVLRAEPSPRTSSTTAGSPAAFRSSRTPGS